MSCMLTTGNHNTHTHYPPISFVARRQKKRRGVWDQMILGPKVLELIAWIRLKPRKCSCEEPEIEDSGRGVFDVEFVGVAPLAAEKLDFVVAIPGGGGFRSCAAAEAVASKTRGVYPGGRQGGLPSSPSNKGAEPGRGNSTKSRLTAATGHDAWPGVAAIEPGVRQAKHGVKDGVSRDNTRTELGEDGEENGASDGLNRLLILLAVEALDAADEALDNCVDVEGTDVGEVVFNGLGLDFTSEAGNPEHNGRLGGRKDGAVGIVQAV
ncbi:hypothetical protein B0H16DRAFT_1463438 [Mycena metata]|uniref:Uncharacterized protein n=1 Tax=Mycena metata TaxID=1033252 RepID=A0AAD7IJP5_9AGAR|nr:hypothetical protein B0H16DRAFT_1463438 [Mycena metata]